MLSLITRIVSSPLRIPYKCRAEGSSRIVHKVLNFLPKRDQPRRKNNKKPTKPQKSLYFYTFYTIFLFNKYPQSRVRVWV